MYNENHRIVLLRERVIKVRLNARENALIDALVDFTGEQKAVLMRDLLMDAVLQALEQSGDIALQKLAAEGA